MADDLAVVVPLELVVDGVEALAVGVEVRRTLRPRVLVGEVAEFSGFDVEHLEHLAADLEGVALLGVLVAAVELGDGAVGDEAFEVFVREEVAGLYLGHARATRPVCKRNRVVGPVRLREEAADGSRYRARDGHDEREGDSDDEDAPAEQPAEPERDVEHGDEQTDEDRDDDAAERAREQAMPEPATESPAGDVAGGEPADDRREQLADHGEDSADDAQHQFDEKPDPDRPPVGHSRE